MCFGEARNPTTVTTARLVPAEVGAGEAAPRSRCRSPSSARRTSSRPARPNVPRVEVVVGFLVVGMVIAIAAFFVTREATRIAKEPPPALYHLDDALAWVVEHVPDDVAATLTTDDVRRILEFQVEFFKRKGVSSNGSTAYPPGTVVIGGSETVDYILERCAATGEALPPRAGLRRDRHPAQLPARHRRGRAPRRPTISDSGGNFPRGDRLPWYKFRYQGKEVVHTMHDQHGTLEVRGR